MSPIQMELPAVGCGLQEMRADFGFFLGGKREGVWQTDAGCILVDLKSVSELFDDCFGHDG